MNDNSPVFQTPSQSGKVYVLEVQEASNAFFTSGEAYFWSLEENNVAVSPLFNSSAGASQWLKFMMANDMIDHRIFQYGIECLCFIDGEYIWYDDARQIPDVDNIFSDYDDAINYKLLGWRKRHG